MKKYKVTGKFYLICLDNDRIIDDKVFINKIVEAEIQREAMELAINFMLEKLIKKYHYYECEKLELREKSDVSVNFYKRK